MYTRHQLCRIIIMIFSRLFRVRFFEDGDQYQGSEDEEEGDVR